jgi:hypothetical protein
MTADLQSIRDRTPPEGGWPPEPKAYPLAASLISERSGISLVEAVAPLSNERPANPPSLTIRPFQASNVISLRQFTNTFNHHHGIQSTERFGVDTDPDGDEFVNELMRADVTAVTLFQAVMAVPGRVI